MLEPRCEKVFTDYIGKNYPTVASDIKSRLISAFEEGSETAKGGEELSRCPYSAVSSPDEFLAWVSWLSVLSAPLRLTGRPPRTDTAVTCHDHARYSAHFHGH